MPRHRWLTFSLALTLVVEVCVAVRSPAISLDGVTFIEIARALRYAPLDAMRTQDQHPGFPAMLVGAHALLTIGRPDDALRPDAGTWILAGQIVAIPCGLGCVALVWLIARRMYDAHVADIAALVAAGLPALRQNAAEVLSDTPHLCAYLLATWCLQEGLARASKAWLLAAGAVSGCAFWIRPEGLSVAIVGCLYLGVALGVGRTPRHQLAAQCLALLCGATLIAGPYVIMTGKLTSKKDPLAAVQKPESYVMPLVGAQVATSHVAAGTLPHWQAAPAVEVAPPPSGRWSSRLPATLKKYCVELGYGFGYIVWIPWVLGHFAPGRRTALPVSLRVLASLALLHSVLLVWLGVAAGYLGHRHVMPIVAVAIPAAAAGIELVGRRAAELVRQPAWGPRLAYAIVLTLAAIALPFSTRPNNSVAAPIVQAATWVRAEASPQETLLANSRYSRLYAELNGPILGIDIPDLAGGLRALQPEFVLLDVDSRAYAPPTAEELGPEYVSAFEARGEGERAWHRVLVYRRIAPSVGARGLRSAGGQGLR